VYLILEERGGGEGKFYNTPLVLQSSLSYGKKDEIKKKGEAWSKSSDE